MTFFQKSPSRALQKFSWKSSRNSAILWSIILGFYTYTKVLGYSKGYTTAASRLSFAKLIDKTSGLDILVGPAVKIQTVGGYTVWATYMVMVLTGIIWGILLVTKHLRGNEESGRLDLVLSGELNLKQLTMSVINGMLMSLLLFFVILTLILVGLGSTASVGLNAGAVSFLGLAVAIGVGLFMLIAGLCCQIMPSRRQSAMLAMIILAISFALKAAGDVSSTKWLLNLTPLGWLEKLRPLNNPRLIWLIPLLILAAVVYLLTVFLSSRRELNGSLIKARVNYKPHLLMLSSLPRISIRFNRGLIIAWASILFFVNLFYGLLAKTSVSLLNSSPTYSKVAHGIATNSRADTAVAYAAVIFLIDMLMLSLFAASCLANIRKDETTKLDINFLSGPVSRIEFFVGKLASQLVGLVIMGLVVSLGYWFGELATGSVLIDLSKLLEAGLNALVPAAIALSIGIFLYGLIPRLSLALTYAVIVFSILISMLSSDLKINHYLNDLSIFSHVKIAPAINANWLHNLLLLIASLIIGLVGLYFYNHRDLITD